MTARKKQKRSAAPPTWREWLQNNARFLVAVAAGLTAAIYLWNTTAPVAVGLYASGPVPLASRDEVNQLRQEGSAALKAISEGLKATAQQAQQAVQQSSDNRKRRLLDQNAELRMRLEEMPRDTLLKELLQKNESDLQEMLDAEKK